MHAKKFMVTNPKTANVDEMVGDVLVRMRDNGLRMLPVLSDDGRVAGVISTFSVMTHIVPDYIVSGDLDSVPYAPDFGLLRRHYKELSVKPVDQVMERPLLVHENESLLSVSAALSNFGKHEYALVVDKDDRLLGVISAGDILDCLRAHMQEEANA